MKLKLAVFDFCPYCQRVRIALEHYGLPYELVTVDPEAPPEWFAAASPRGKVPLLMVDDTPILESAVIGEFVDEIGGRRLMPDDPLARAQVRFWADFASACQMGFGNMLRAVDEEAFVRHVATCTRIWRMSIASWMTSGPISAVVVSVSSMWFSRLCSRAC
jgi:glutathione S-transferase